MYYTTIFHRFGFRTKILLFYQQLRIGLNQKATALGLTPCGRCKDRAVERSCLLVTAPRDRSRTLPCRHLKHPLQHNNPYQIFDAVHVSVGHSDLLPFSF